MIFEKIRKKRKMKLERKKLIKRLCKNLDKNYSNVDDYEFLGFETTTRTYPKKK
ncbi:MAG: hypothetical protein KAU62_02580 [Candidatus Heimdallarchaeota archaeon]|nr:hypothetical protein [Candidatus Heimdallarchaeota archaeon]MCK4610022.1 hypothetical protein [Candidatus Heimdallarchaeota archaeon]